MGAERGRGTAERAIKSKLENFFVKEEKIVDEESKREEKANYFPFFVQSRPKLPQPNNNLSRGTAAGWPSMVGAREGGN
jgi:hypothetical protein